MITSLDFSVSPPRKRGCWASDVHLPALAGGNTHISETAQSIPPPLVGGGKGEGVARGSAPENRLADRAAGVIRACRRETPPPAPAHKGRGNACRVDAATRESRSAFAGVTARKIGI